MQSFNNSTGTSDNAVVFLNETPYVTFDSVQMINFSSGTYGSGLHVVNSAYTTFKNGSIYVDTVSTSSSTQAFGLTSSTTSLTSSGTKRDYFTLENSELVGGY